MHRWITRLFLLTTFGPVIIWAGCFIGFIILAEVYGCRIDEAGVYPCEIRGRDYGKAGAMMLLLGAWGPLIFGPFVLASGLAWGLYTLIRAMRRRRDAQSKG